MTPLIIGVLGLLAVAGATAFGPRVGIATPLLLVVLGIVVGLIPAVPDLPIDPEWLLLGVLPPLLYSSSVSMPSMNFRREFGAIGGLSVVLVIASSLLLGLFFAWAIPDLPLAWAIALGAVVSPTDAVATSIIKKLGVSPRVVSILEGESLLNDATALVTLRSAVAAVALSFSAIGALGSFAYAVLVAVAIGFAVGKVNLLVRKRVQDATVNTVIGFAVPFIAALPTEALGASGLVAAVVAGLVTGRGAPRVLSPQHRLSDAQNWRTVELVLEGALFLTMGLQLSRILSDVHEDSVGVPLALLIAAGAFVITLGVRALYLSLLLNGLKKRAARMAKSKDRFTTMQGQIDSGEPLAITDGSRRGASRAGQERFEKARQDPTRLA
ncbi:NhaP-type Na+/H+ or K+/H+ antiporter [Frondihabitans sp. PhB188]|uniref:cation:proton antiporter n=1 Tax=Frondihabitans sp. PhB188 TaxID=2485200 RepID=UPI000F9FE87F|nr:cation:proton antiporter [Frondihabitans sp. PhB188]ROQ39723.1 NhaP-type Na+/H+ or K+/H+ antiporter [Frondihabitans sp. PhB188]